MNRGLEIGWVQFRLLKALAEAEDYTIRGYSSPEMKAALMANPIGVPPRYTDRRLNPPTDMELGGQASGAAKGLVVKGYAAVSWAPNPIQYDKGGPKTVRTVTITEAGLEYWAKICTPEARAALRIQKRRHLSTKQSLYAGWRKAKHPMGTGWRYVASKWGWTCLLERDGATGAWMYKLIRPDKLQTPLMRAKRGNLRDAKREAGDLLITEAAEWKSNEVRN